MARRFSLLLSSLLTVGLAALPAQASEVVLYSSNHVDAINTVVTEFNKKHPDIKVSVVRAGSGALMQRIKAEAANPRADIFWSGGFFGNGKRRAGLWRKCRWRGRQNWLRIA